MGSNTAASAFLGPAPELAMWSIDSFNLAGAWNDTELNRWDTGLRGVTRARPTSSRRPHRPR